jgi:uncharacterized protein (DUF1501 family)
MNRDTAEEQHTADCGCPEYNELSRREFLSGATTAAVGFAFPDWLPRIVLAEGHSSTRDVLVSVFLRGGADGLSLCVPYGEGNNYYTARTTIAIPPPDSLSANRGIDLDGFFAFPQAMSGLLDAYNDGSLLIAHAAGQFNTSRSHFDAMRYMEVGKPADPSIVTGWLGRHLASMPPLRTDAPLRALGLAQGLQKTLVGAPRTLPIANPASFLLAGLSATQNDRLAFLENDYALEEEPVLHASALDAINTITLLRNINFSGYQPSNGAVYPNTAFGRSLKSVATLIKADVGIEAAQVDLGGWDTHASQDPIAGSMFNTMVNLSNSLGAFHADVVAMGHSVTIVAISEFGRNVRQNGSDGTDHGRGTVAFAMGNNIAGGRVLTVDWPGLATQQLESGRDLRVTVDYRHLLAEVVENRLGNSNLDFVFPGFAPVNLGVTV